MSRTALACLLALLGGSAAAQQGLTLKPDSAGATWRLGSVQLSVSVADLGPAQRARLFGDYFLTGPGFGDGQVSGGLRLTSGLSVGPRHSTFSLPPGGSGDGLRVGTRTALGALTDRDAERVMLPYVGLGYTSLSLRAGWAFTADIGLGGLRPGERVQLGYNGAAAAQVESILNSLRLQPVIQLGVSYAF